MTEYRIRHLTRYSYTEPVSLCQNVARLTPRECDSQVCSATTLEVTPVPAVIDRRPDFFGNPATYFAVQEPHRELTVLARHTVRVRVANPPYALATPPWEAVRDRLRADASPPWLDAAQFAFGSRYATAHPDYARYAAGSFSPGRAIMDAALDLTRRVHRDFTYDPRATTVTTPVAAVFEDRRGVCQDFAHVVLACLRSLGLAARYVSGYLATVGSPNEARLVGADASHAWTSVFCGESGWIDLDPTNDQIPSDKHIVLAWGRDYDDVSPVKGVVHGGGQHTVSVSVDAEPVP